MDKLQLTIVMPTEKVFEGEAERVMVRTTEGEVAILPRHIDYAAALDSGEARVTVGGETRRLMLRHIHPVERRAAEVLARRDGQLHPGDSLQLGGHAVELALEEAGKHRQEELPGPDSPYPDAEGDPPVGQHLVDRADGRAAVPG